MAAFRVCSHVVVFHLKHNALCDVIVAEPLTCMADHSLVQRSGTYGSRARCGSFDDGIWLA